MIREFSFNCKTYKTAHTNLNRTVAVLVFQNHNLIIQFEAPRIPFLDAFTSMIIVVMLLLQNIQHYTHKTSTLLMIQTLKLTESHKLAFFLCTNPYD